MAQDSYRVLARKWRPQSFDDVVGQEHISRTLRNAIRSGRIGHAFLFIGTRGVGKTTTARILAKALNCMASETPTAEPCGVCHNCVSIASGSNLDVFEIDGASNNGVEHVRDIRDNIRMVPSTSRYKIYIIDEVHQLTSAAFNALLKTLEEPPEHAIFILATTESHKVPATIVSRCQRFDFRRVGMEPTTDLLRKILEAEGVGYTEEALHAIARAADGSIRDGQSILEQLISYCGDTITFQDVFDVLGLVNWDVMHELADAIHGQDIGAQLRIVEDVVASGRYLSQFVQDILRYYRNLLVCKTTQAKELLSLPDDEIEGMRARSERYTLTTLIRLVEQFAELTRGFDSQLAQRIALESLIIRISKVTVEVSLDAVLEKLAYLGAGGLVPAAPGVGVVASPAGRVQSAGKPVELETAAKELKPSGEAPAAPRRGKRPTIVTKATMGKAWGELAQALSGENLSLGIALGQGIPSDIDGETLVLTYASCHARSLEIVTRTENTSAVNEALARVASNLKGFRASLALDAGGDSIQETGRNGAASSQSTQKQMLAQLDPKITDVVDVFKGTIVSVTRKPQETESEPEPET